MGRSAAGEADHRQRHAYLTVPVPPPDPPDRLQRGERRKRNDAHVAETGQLAQHEFFPAMKKAKGFVAFYLIEEATENLVIAMWQSKADSDAFRKEPVVEQWAKTVDEHGHQRVSSGGGEVRQHFTAEK